MRKENKRKKGIQRVRGRNKQGAGKKSDSSTKRNISNEHQRYNEKIKVREGVGNSWLTCRAVN